MRHQAWLCAVPESKTKGQQADSKSRMQRFTEQEDDGLTAPLLTLPELEACATYLVDWLHQAGTVGHGPAGGVVPLSWLEFNAWCALSGNRPTPWEADTVIALSRAYAAMSQKATDPDCPAPHTPDDFDRHALGNKIKQGLRGFAKKK